MLSENTPKTKNILNYSKWDDWNLKIFPPNTSNGKIITMLEITKKKILLFNL